MNYTFTLYITITHPIYIEVKQVPIYRPIYKVIVIQSIFLYIGQVVRSLPLRLIYKISNKDGSSVGLSPASRPNKLLI